MKLKMIVLYWSLSRANMHSKKQLHCIFVYNYIAYLFMAIKNITLELLISLKEVKNEVHRDINFKRKVTLE